MIAFKLCILTSVDVRIIEMTSVLWRDGDHQRVCHYISEAICQAGPHSLEASLGDEGLSFRGQQIRASQNLCVLVEESRQNVIIEKAQVP